MQLRPDTLLHRSCDAILAAERRSIQEARPQGVHALGVCLSRLGRDGSFPPVRHWQFTLNTQIYDFVLRSNSSSWLAPRSVALSVWMKHRSASQEKCHSCVSLWGPLGHTPPSINKTLLGPYQALQGTNTQVTSTKGHFCAYPTYPQVTSTIITIIKNNKQELQ